jgi:hypothetical protein
LAYNPNGDYFFPVWDIGKYANDIVMKLYSLKCQKMWNTVTKNIVNAVNIGIQTGRRASTKEYKGRNKVEKNFRGKNKLCLQQYNLMNLEKVKNTEKTTKNKITKVKINFN